MGVGMAEASMIRVWVVEALTANGTKVVRARAAITNSLNRRRLKNSFGFVNLLITFSLSLTCNHAG